MTSDDDREARVHGPAGAHEPNAHDETWTRIRAYLKARRWRMGKARERAIALVLAAPPGFTIPSLLVGLDTIERTTVYRCVRILLDAGVLVAVGHASGTVRYALAGDRVVSVCPRCGFRFG